MNSVFFTNVNFLLGSRKQSISYHFRPTSSIATKFLLPIIRYPLSGPSFSTTRITQFQSSSPSWALNSRRVLSWRKNSSTKNRLFRRTNKMDKFRRSPMKSSSPPGFTARRVFLLQLDKFIFLSFSTSFRFWFDFVQKAFDFTRKFLDFSINIIFF